MKSIQNVGQAAILAKMLFVNSFLAVYRNLNKSGNQVRGREFPKD